MESADKAVGSFIQFFERLITDFTWRRFGFVAGFVILIGLIFVVYEFYTRSFMLARLDHETMLLTKIVTLEESSSNITDANLVTSLDSLKTRIRILMQSPKDTVVPLGVQKVIYTLIPWIAMALLITLASGSDGRKVAIAGMGFFALPLVILNANLPTFQPQWINNWLLPWTEAVVVVVFVITWQRKKKAKAT